MPTDESLAVSIEHLFRAQICMEDCAPKPSPEPIRLALKALDVDAKDALMIGDTVDDVLAAVAAGVEGVGVLTPQAYAKTVLELKPTTVETRLRASGARLVLNPGLGELMDLIQVPVANAAPCSGPRSAQISRVTKETSIDVKLVLDGTGKSKVRGAQSDSDAVRLTE